MIIVVIILVPLINNSKNQKAYIINENNYALIVQTLL